MSVNIFKRGLNTKLLELLAAARNSNSWWKSIVDDKDLFIAIRDDYLNVYYQGNSLMKISESSGKLICDIHYKYLLSPSHSKPYVKFEDSLAVNFGAESRASLLANELTSKTISDLKKAAKVYGGEEKEGVHKIMLSNENIIDTEIAFSVKDENSDQTTAKRIDFAALRTGANGQNEIVFYEAKHYSNSELFAQTGEPKVVGQIRVYEQEYIEKMQAEIISAYSQYFDDFQKITGTSLGTAPVAVNPNVRLVIFGFDQDQKEGSNFNRRINKLKKYLEDEYILLKGDAKDFRSGISN